MQGAYKGLMRAAQAGLGPDPNAMLVHHEGNPAYTRIEEGLRSIDQELAAMDPSHPDYDNFLGFKNQLSSAKNKILQGHDLYQRRQKLGTTQKDLGSILADPAIVPLEQGLNPRSGR